jgi:hypothetical protein
MAARQEMRAWRADYALRIAEEPRLLTADELERTHRLLADAPPEFVQRKQDEVREPGLLGGFLWYRPGLCQCRFRMAI